MQAPHFATKYHFFLFCFKKMKHHSMQNAKKIKYNACPKKERKFILPKKENRSQRCCINAIWLSNNCFYSSHNFFVTLYFSFKQIFLYFVDCLLIRKNTMQFFVLFHCWLCLFVVVVVEFSFDSHICNM